LDARTLVVLPRAPRSADAETFGWYHVTFDAGEPQVLVAQLQSHHDIAPSRTMVAGFSQGGALAASIALAKPTCVAGFAMIAGRLLPETVTAHGDAFSSLRALVVHGRQDQTLPPDHATQTAGHLQRLGIEHALHLHDAGHALTASMQADVAAWFDDPQQPWNV
jgi:phospholipase/carboxylesterase